MPRKGALKKKRTVNEIKEAYINARCNKRRTFLRLERLADGETTTESAGKLIKQWTPARNEVLKEKHEQYLAKVKAGGFRK